MWDLRGSQQDLFLFYQVGLEVANSQSWPNWLPGKEFKAIRDLIAAALTSLDENLQATMLLWPEF